MGGMRVLEWCVGYPDRVARAAVLAVGASATAEEIALCSLQCRAIRLDPDFLGGDYYGSDRAPRAGMALARGIGQLSYRTAAEFDRRFGRRPQDGEHPSDGGRFAVESYLDHHGRKLVGRFDPNSYLVLSEAMNSHDGARSGRHGRLAGTRPRRRSPSPGSTPTGSTRSPSRRNWPGASPAARRRPSSPPSPAMTASCSSPTRSAPWSPPPSTADRATGGAPGAVAPRRATGAGRFGVRGTPSRSADHMCRRKHTCVRPRFGTFFPCCHRESLVPLRDGEETARQSRTGAGGWRAATRGGRRPIGRCRRTPGPPRPPDGGQRGVRRTRPGAAPFRPGGAARSEPGAPGRPLGCRRRHRLRLRGRQCRGGREPGPRDGCARRVAAVAVAPRADRYLPVRAVHRRRVHG